MMDSEHSKKIERLCALALQRPPEERAIFLAGACADDATLRQEVEALLQKQEGFLEEPALDVAARDLAKDSPTLVEQSPETDSNISQGDTISHYQILDTLGQGGMGVVYLAKDTRLQRNVALKFLPSDHFRDPQLVKRFEREARAASALDHPNICTIYDIDAHAGEPFIAMQHLQGQTLKQRLEGEPMPLGEILKLSTQIADALETAHSQGIVHRDIKPANIFVTDRGDAKVLDFGLAKQLTDSDLESDLTGTGVTLGTLAFMSPEQVRGQKVDARSDIFSLGVVLYQMVTGVHPFRKESAAEMATAIQTEEPAPLARYRHDVPELLEHIVRKMLAKRPEGRHQTMQGVHNDLQLLVEDSDKSAPIQARVAAGKRGWLLAGVGVLVTVVVVVVLAWRSESAPPPARVLRPVPLTSQSGVESQPAFSPDGSQVVFVWDGPNQDNLDIYIKVIGSERLRRITSDPSPDGSPVWSSDGRQIAFLRASRDGDTELRLVSPTGGAERVVTRVQGLETSRGLSWSPDGRLFAVPDRSSGSKAFGIALFDRETSTTRHLTDPVNLTIGDSQPGFSPDGERLVFRRQVGVTSSQIAIVSLSTGQLRLVTTPGRPLRSAAWTSSGEALVVPIASSATAESAATLWEIPLEGSPRLLPVQTGAVDVAVAGRRLVFSSRDDRHEIWRVDLAKNRHSHERFLPSNSLQVNAQFSPGGRQVVFTSNRSGDTEIWVSDSDGSNLFQLTSFGRTRTVGSPRWSPDEERVAFDSAAIGKGTDIYVADVSGGSPRPITQHTASDVMPAWSRDGEWLYFASDRSGEWQIWKVREDTPGNALQVTKGGGFGPALESPDGLDLYFSERRSSSEDPANAIWKIRLEGGERILVVGSHGSSHTNWDVTSRGIYYVDKPDAGSGAGWVVQLLGFDPGPVRTVADLGGTGGTPYLEGSAFGVSPDDRWLLSTQVKRESDLMLVEDFQ